MGDPLKEAQAYANDYEESLIETKRLLAIQRKFCWESVLVKSKSILDKLSFDERRELEMRIKNATCVTECQNFELLYY